MQDQCKTPDVVLLIRATYQLCPTGKSLLIFRSRIKPQNQKYFAFAVGQISGMNLPDSPDKRGGGMRWTRNARKTNAHDAYGEVVWS